MYITTLYRRTLPSAVRTAEEINEHIRPTGEHWLSPDRNTFYQAVCRIDGWSLLDILKVARKRGVKIVVGDVLVDDQGRQYMVDHNESFTQLNKKREEGIEDRIVKAIHAAIRKDQSRRKPLMILLENLAMGKFDERGIANIAHRFNVA